jgi:hypothetical protein
MQPTHNSQQRGADWGSAGRSTGARVAAPWEVQIAPPIAGISPAIPRTINW